MPRNFGGWGNLPPVAPVQLKHEQGGRDEEKNDQQNNNRINGLIGKKVYTDDGDYIGKINDVILDKNRMSSIRLQIY